MTRPEDAAAYFNEGFSCSQAVVSSFSEDLGLHKETARTISCGFGAGMARTGNVCGAVTGAMMVIGLKYGKTSAGDDAAKGGPIHWYRNSLENSERRTGRSTARNSSDITCEIPSSVNKLMRLKQ